MIREASFNKKEHSASMAMLLREAARAWRPRKLPTTDQWAVEHVRLPSDISANPGAFDLQARPYWREPLLCMDDPSIETITLEGSAQEGKTVALISMLLSRMDLDAAPAMLVGPDQDAMREMRDKVYAYCEASPTLATRIPPQTKRNDRFLEFDTLICYLAYSGSAQRMRSRTCKNIFCTEIDVWQDDPVLGDPVMVVRARAKAWDEHKIIYESTPSDEASRIDSLYRDSDQRRLHCPCPHCGTYQELRFFPHTGGAHAGRGGIRGHLDEHGEPRSPESAAQHVYYQCVSCDVPILNEDKQEMIARGVWCPRGAFVNSRGEIEGKSDRETKNVGFHFWSIFAPNITFADLATQYLVHRAKGLLKVFFNNWLGLPYKITSKMPEWRKLGQRLRVPYYSSGTVPSSAYFVTCGVDVQGDRIYYAVRAWGEDKTSWSVERGCLRPELLEMDGELRRFADTNNIAADLVQLWPRIINRRWPVVGGRSKLGHDVIGCRALGCDSQYRTREVQQFVRQAGVNASKTIVRAVRGDQSVGWASQQQLYKVSHVERNARTGELYEGGLDVWGIAVSAYKEDLVARYEKPTDQPGAWMLPGDIFQGGEDYLRQLVNEAPQLVKSEGKREKIVWTVIDGGVGNHYWDCEVYASALADMVAGNDWNLKRWLADSPRSQTRSEQAEIVRGSNAMDQDIAAR
jgi:phage terminase large subunit GpA-like protein